MDLNYKSIARRNTTFYATDSNSIRLFNSDEYYFYSACFWSVMFVHKNNTSKQYFSSIWHGRLALFHPVGGEFASCIFFDGIYFFITFFTTYFYPRKKKT